MNKVILMGRLTKDPEVNTTANGNTIARFNLAVDRRYKSDGQPTADFPSIVAFNKTAEFVEKYIHKGMKIALEGRIQTGNYDKDGVKHYTTDVIADSVEFAESKKADNTQQESGDEWQEMPDNMDLPFE